MTTTDSVESISGGLAKRPSQVLNPPSSSLKAYPCVVVPMRLTASSYVDTVPSGKTPDNST